MSRNRSLELFPDEQALLATIWESPLDDAPRLVYADWLQETNKPANIARAEFIRVQCELAKLDSWEVRAKEISKREEELLAIFDPEKLLPKFEDEPELPYIRGFLEPRLTNQVNRHDLTIPFEEVFSHIQDHYWAAPSWDIALHFAEEVGNLFDFRTHFHRIRCLTLQTTDFEIVEEEEELGNWPIERDPMMHDSDFKTAIDALSSVPWASLTELSLYLPLAESISNQLKQSPNLNQIQVLRLWTQALPDARGLRILFESGKLKQLRKLVVSSSGNNGAILRLLQPIQLPSLTSLEISGGIFDDRSMKRLCQWDLLHQLHELRLPSSHSLTPDGFQLLAQCSRLNRLRALQICADSEEFEGLKELSRSPYLKDLEYLVVQEYYSEDREEIETLLRPQFGNRLEIVDAPEDRDLPF